MMRDDEPNPVDVITLEPTFAAPQTCACVSQPLAVAAPSPITESVCPECLARIPARRVTRCDDVYLKKAARSTVIFKPLSGVVSQPFPDGCGPKSPPRRKTRSRRWHTAARLTAVSAPTTASTPAPPCSK